MEHIDLSSGASYFRSPGVATAAAIAALKCGKTTYGPTEGTPALRTAVARRYKQEGINVRPDQILITPGGKQALFNLFTVLLREQDEVLIPTPSWFGFHGLMKHSKGKLIDLPTFLSDSYTINLKALQKAITKQSRILLLTNPGNPTGRLYSKEELEGILEITAPFPELYIIADEIYDFHTYGKPFTSILSCQGAVPERTVIVNGFSKTFAMSGWRIGYMTGPATLIERCAAFQADTLSGVSLFIQDAATSALKRKEEALAPMVDILNEHRSIMRQGLEAIPHINFYLPDGAYYFFPDFNFYMGASTPAGKTIYTSVELCRHLEEHYALQLSPGDYFGAPGHARMSFAVERAKLTAGLYRLKEALLSLKAPA